MAQQEAGKSSNPTDITTSKNFAFLEDNHILITTPSQICAWDSSGIHIILKSRRSGIVAAREAKDGSGVLAVADEQNVVLHDSKRGRDQSWGLEANGDVIRYLEYTSDAKSLFITTNLTADIQRYSTEQRKLLEPAKAHASPPVALAISRTGHLLISASDHPPAIYLQNLAHNTVPVLIEPRASKAAVSVAAFHPERPSIFLLAFRDGTIAAYDATKLTRANAEDLSNQESINRSEISRLTTLHRPSSAEHGRASITDAGFLHGFKTRAVAVGSDGRCRIVDFAEGGCVLRTWHAKAPVTSVSVFAKSQPLVNSTRKSAKSAPHLIGGPTNADNMIAIGRADGIVHVYDSVGLLLGQCSINANGDKVISVEWVKGPCPKSVHRRSPPNAISELPYVTSKAQMASLDSRRAIDNATTIARLHASLQQGPAVHPALRSSVSSIPRNTPRGSTRQFTIHPDEVTAGTVRHTPLAQPSQQLPTALSKYLDLFSPCKPSEAAPEQKSEKRLSSPPRSRPAITTQTFIKSPQSVLLEHDDQQSRRRNLALFPSTESDFEAISPTSLPQPLKKRPDDTMISIAKPTKRITFKTNSRANPRRSSIAQKALIPSNDNAKIFADLRKMGAVRPGHRNGTSAAVIPTTEDRGNKQVVHSKGQRSSLLRRPIDHIDSHYGSEVALEEYEHAHKRHRWPTDSVQDGSALEDIWLTSDSNETTKRSRRRRRISERPQATQASCIAMAPSESVEPTAMNASSATPVSQSRHQRLDGSTDEDVFTAESRMTSSDAFAPSSQDVRELFPRTSSLSPNKRQKSGKRKQSRKRSARTREAQDMNLRELVPNQVSGRVARSPWARAKAERTGRGLVHIQKQDGADSVQAIERATTDHGKENDDQGHCSVCGPTKDRLIELEAEVTRLKGEVLVFKSVLRRQGVPLPASLR